jgi:hypothetical protein
MSLEVPSLAGPAQCLKAGRLLVAELRGRRNVNSPTGSPANARRVAGRLHGADPYGLNVPRVFGWNLGPHPSNEQAIPKF